MAYLGSFTNKTRRTRKIIKFCECLPANCDFRRPPWTLSGAEGRVEGDSRLGSTRANLFANHLDLFFLQSVNNSFNGEFVI
jgi:hypothetical protein